MKLIELSKLVKIYLIFLLFCIQKHSILKEESKEPYASSRFSNFYRIEYKGIGIKKWELSADEAYIYNAEKTNEILRIIVYNFSFKQFLPSQANIKSQKASIDYIEKIMYISTGAIYEDNTITIKGNELKYDLEKEILSSDLETEIIKGNNKIKCLKGIYYNKKEEIQKCKKPEGQIFQNKAKQTSTKEYFF